MAYCSKCGAEVQGNFCSICGNSVNGASTQQNVCNTESGVYTVGDFTYTDDDLKFYENKLNDDISKAEINKKISILLIPLGVMMGIYALIIWNKSGFLNTLESHFCLFLGAFLLAIGVYSINKYKNKITNLNQYNAYSYMMKHIQEAQKWQAVNEGLQTFNKGLKAMNNAYKIGQFLGRL